MFQVFYTQKAKHTPQEQLKNWREAAKWYELPVAPEATIEEIKELIIKHGKENFYDFHQAPHDGDIMWGFIID
jgi:hypothetical protein